jgi:DNA-binding transcriptional LysR family regulator
MPATIHAMNIFARAVESNSFVSAARSLLLDPAAVSRAVKNLEMDLGVLLFARSTRALKLTAEGARFYRDCVQVLKKYEEATLQFRIDKEKPRGLLKVGLATGLTKRMILRAIPSFQRQFPDVEIVLLSVHDTADLADKGIDVLIRARSLRQRGGQHPEPQGLVVRKLVRTRRVACAAPTYLERAGVPRIPSDLLHHACIAHLSLERDVQDEWQFAKSHVRQKIKFVPKLLAQDSDALREAAVAGCGIIRTLACHLVDELRSGALVPVLPDWECSGPPPSVVAVYRKTNPMPPQLSAFVGHLTRDFQPYNVKS